MKTSGSNKKVREIVTGIREGRFEPRPEFQRRLVWAQKHKNAFVKTVLEGYPFPEVYFANGDVDLESGEGSILIVDGQQRLTTLYEYFTGASSLVLEAGLKPYLELREEQKRSFLDYDVVVRDLGSLEMEQIKIVFQRINSTAYSLNAMEMANARWDGAFKQFAQDFSEDYFFERHRVFTAKDGRRMNDIRLCATIVISIMTSYFHRDDAIEGFLKEYNDEFPESEIYRSRIRRVLELLDCLELADDNRVWKKADFLTAFVETDRFLESGKMLDISTFSQVLGEFDQIDQKEVGSSDNLETFLSLVPDVTQDALEEYFRAAIQASNDRINRHRRAYVIAKILKNSKLETSENGEH